MAPREGMTPAPNPFEDPHAQGRRSAPSATEIAMLSVYLLALFVVLLVIYLFYAVINPEKF